MMWCYFQLLSILGEILFSTGTRQIFSLALQPRKLLDKSVWDQTEMFHHHKINNATHRPFYPFFSRASQRSSTWPKWIQTNQWIQRKTEYKQITSNLKWKQVTAFRTPRQDALFLSFFNVESCQSWPQPQSKHESCWFSPVFSETQGTCRHSSSDVTLDNWNPSSSIHSEGSLLWSQANGWFASNLQCCFSAHCFGGWHSYVSYSAGTAHWLHNALQHSGSCAHKLVLLLLVLVLVVLLLVLLQLGLEELFLSCISVF